MLNRFAQLSLHESKEDWSIILIQGFHLFLSDLGNIQQVWKKKEFIYEYVHILRRHSGIVGSKTLWHACGQNSNVVSTIRAVWV